MLTPRVRERPQQRYGRVYACASSYTKPYGHDSLYDKHNCGAEYDAKTKTRQQGKAASQPRSPKAQVLKLDADQEVLLQEREKEVNTLILTLEQGLLTLEHVFL